MTNMDLLKYQSKSITIVDEYFCTLNDELRKIALDELGETDEIRTNGIKVMRDWIMKNPRIEKCRMDSKFILRFLRFRKFNIAKAQDAFERYLIFREGAYGYDWFSNMDFSKPNINGLLDNGLVMLFPCRDKLGRRVLMTRLAAADPSISTIGCEGLTVGTMALETLLEDEENQIRGMNYIGDISNIKLRHYFIFSFTTWFRFGKNVEKTLAARHKGFNLVNIHPTLTFIANLAMSHMPEKLKKRVHFYSDFSELDIVDREFLPVDCGGNVEVEKFIEPLKKTLEAKKNFFLNYNNMKVKHNLYPESVLQCDVSSLSTPLGSSKVSKIKQQMPISTYRKIEFD